MTHENLIEGYEIQSRIEEFKYEMSIMDKISNSINPIGLANEKVLQDSGLYSGNWTLNFADMVKDCAKRRIEEIKSEIDKLEKEFEKI